MYYDYRELLSEEANTFLSDEGDFKTIFQFYRQWLRHRLGVSNEREIPSAKQQSRTTHRSAREWCRRVGVEESRMFELNRLASQLLDILTQGIQLSPKTPQNAVAPNAMAQLETHSSETAASTLQKQWDSVNTLEAVPNQSEQYIHLQEKKRKLRQLKGSGRLHKSKVLRLPNNLTGASEFEELDEDDGYSSDDVKRKRNKRRVSHNFSLSQQTIYDMQRNLEFDIKYEKHRHTQAVVGRFSSHQATLLNIVLCISFYPNIALPYESNRMKLNCAECVFQTRYIEYANIHPGSFLYTKANAIDFTEAIVFGILLQTTKPYLTHLSRVKLLPLLLLSAHKIEANRDFSMLIADQWIRIQGEPTALVHLLCEAITLRFNIQLRMDPLITALFHTGNEKVNVLKFHEMQENADFWESVDDDDSYCVDPEILNSLPQDLATILTAKNKALPQKQFEKSLIQFFNETTAFHRQPLRFSEYTSYRMRRDSLEEPKDITLNLKTNEFIRMEEPSSPPLLESSKLCNWLYFNCLNDTISMDSARISDHLTISWKCPNCEVKFTFNRIEIDTHQSTCKALGASSDQKITRETCTGLSVDEEVPMRPRIEEESLLYADSICNDSEQPQCMYCSIVFPPNVSSLQRLQHMRTHGM